MNVSYLNSAQNNVLASKPSKAIGLFLMVLFVYLSTNSSKAQTFNASTNPSISTSGVALANYVSLGTLISNGQDDTNSSLTNIGFDFWFNGTLYTQFGVSANGYIKLGSTPTATGTATYTNNLANGADVPKIAPFWDDLTTGSDGYVKYGINGIAPNRTLVVEWKTNLYSTGAIGNSAGMIFQVVLSESTGKIQFIYGSGMLTSAGYSIGFATSTSNLLSMATATNATTYGSDPNSTQTTGIASGKSYEFTPIGTYKAQIISANTGSATWCAGETRTVSVTIKNTGTQPWIDGGGRDFNIGVKWNTNGTSWPDYNVRVDAANLAPGATTTYNFSLTASNNDSGSYTTPLGAGTNNISFDVVYEAVAWFGNNNTSAGVGPGNAVYTTVNQTISALPTISLQPSTTAQNLCKNGTAATALSVSAAAGSGTIKQYDWFSNTTASNTGGTLVKTNVSSATPNTYTPPNTVAGTLYYYVVVTNSNGCTLTSAVSGAINVSPSAPATPGSISGSATQCAGNTLQTYSVAAVPNATSYNWTLPANWTITAGLGTNSITVSIASNGATNNVSVNASNACGTSSSSYQWVVVSTPTVAGTVTPANTNVCSGSNSTNLSLSGQTGSILRWESSTDNFAGGTITTIASTGSPITAPNVSVDTYYRAVVQSGGCNVLNTSSAKLTVVGAMTNPGGISINGVAYPVNGSTANCTSTTMTFSIASIANATSYTWAVGTGWSIVSGQGTNTVSVTTGNTSQSNNISVYATNGTCPNTGSSYLYVNLYNAPTTPTGISFQSFCSGSTVASLSATGSNVKWYATATGGTPLASTTILTNGTHYYATQNPSGCESTTRFDVTVTINSPIITPNKVDETCPISNNGSISPVLSGGLSNIRFIKLTQKYASWQQVEEIQAFEIFTGTNVALTSNGGTATSSSNYSNDATNYGPQKSIDGDSTGYSFWHSNSTNINEYIIVDLASAKNLDYIRIFNRTDCCQDRGQNMLLELMDASSNVIYSKTVDLYQSGANIPVNVNVLDVSWQDGATTLNRTSLDSGTYTLNYSDALGCSISSPIVIGSSNSGPSAPTIGTITQPNCVTNTGSVVLNSLPTSGSWTLYLNGSSIYSTTGGSGSYTVSGLNAGTYNFTVSNGSCTSVASANAVTNAVVTTTYNGSWSTTPNLTMIGIVNSNTPIASNVDLCSCTVNTGVNAVVNSGVTLKLQDKLTVTTGGSLTFNDTASLVQINNVINSGDIIYNRTTNTQVRNTDYTYWATPVLPLKLAGTGGISYSSTPLAGSIFYSYSVTPTTEGWKSETATTAMAAGYGYSIRGPGSISASPMGFLTATFKGVPNNGDYLVVIAKNNASYLLGNPYPSAISADKFLTDNSGVLDGTLYFWTHNTVIQDRTNINSPGSGAFAYTADDYASYNLTGGAGVGNFIDANKNGIFDPGEEVIANRPTGKIGAGQGFFATSIAASGNIVFTNSMRMISNAPIANTQFFKTKNPTGKTAQIEKNRVWLNLTNTQGAFKQTLIGYVTGATNEMDSAYDGESFDGQEFIDFYSINSDKNLTIQGRALPFDENDEVPLGFRSTIEGPFTINIDEVDGSMTNQEVFLEDKMTNTTTNLKTGNYTFNTVAGTFNERFVLRYTNGKTLGTNTVVAQENKVLVSVKNKQIKINSYSETISKVTIFDLLGREIYLKDKLESNEFLTTDFSASHQALIVKTTLQNGKIVTDKIIY